VAVVGDALPERAEAVASADAWAVQGTKLGGRAGAQRLLEAASLRERIFRADHREADALEALELYRQAAREPALRCSAALAAALLEGELRADPSVSFQGVSRAQRAAGDAPCQARAEAILSTLSAYRPLPTVLAQLDAEGAASAAPGAQPAPAPLPPGSAEASANDGVIVPTLSAPRGPARVTKIERYGAPDAARVVVYVTQPSTYKVGFLEQGSQSPRLFVDIDGATYQGAKSFDVGGLVARVRVGAEPSHTRVVLDLTATAYRKVFYVPEPFRLVIDVSKDAPTAHAEETSHGPRQIHRVVLDPGHGGHDPGASGPSGLREKDVTLDIAHRAAPLIARELGISTLLTRDSDDYVALDERTARANAFQADLFVSIHCNASEDGAGRGVMTFVLDDSRDPTSTRVAARENDSSTAAAAELAGALTRGEGGQSPGRSNHFAELLQRAAIASLSPSYGDIPDSGIRRAGFYVLAGARMPAVLFETSFISNPVGETRFNTGDFRQKIADAIVNAIRAYRDGL
jgi:N-acetylmuramoyl-L-alanine amidase